ncbi:hypothetical protein [Streptomyces aidingensis]|uniref:PH domain-containing protein n=1 Tax=Streptomyces aidingensis TaxID=910347 RepID=A0A1I1E6I1_9ACTN|nr:hypothetical protein [Streptomyces aidingensis]SFB82266.1 hypothetical protein SAMN05421773_101138 [Streptomyces aidingensis]
MAQEREPVQGAGGEAHHGLGEMVREHPVDNRRRGRHAAWWLGSGGLALLGSAVPALLGVTGAGSPVPAAVPGVLAPLGMIAVLTGLDPALGWARARSGGESVSRHQGGLLHRRGALWWSYPWARVYQLGMSRRERRLQRELRPGPEYAVRVHGRPVLYLSPYLRDAELLARETGRELRRRRLPVDI